MSSDVLRILLLADTHLGFDLPERPRLERRRRGLDFFANFERALRPAREGMVDLIVHGGDLFHRRRVSLSVMEGALMPLAEIARSGVPVLVVPGNHEGSRIPLHLATATPNLHIFHRPQTVLLKIQGIRVSLSGFPFTWRIADKFNQLMSECDYAGVEADCRLLCLHQSVEGATVGVQDFTFRSGSDVISGRSIPAAFDAVLAGHIHRGQHLTHDLMDRKLPAPVIYPGSVERTSFAERDETKQYALVTMSRPSGESRFQARVAFESLPARPMVVLPIETHDWHATELTTRLQKEIRALDPNAVVQVRFSGPLTEELASVANVATLRSLAPSSMNISLFASRQPNAKGSQ